MRRIFLLLMLLSLLSCKKEQGPQQQAPEVPVAAVLQKDVSITEEFVGQIYGGSDIQIRARVQGWMTQKHFIEGSEVRKGQLLYTIDPLPYQTKVDQAKGQLAEAEANLVKSRNDLDRIKPLALHAGELVRVPVRNGVILTARIIRISKFRTYFGSPLKTVRSTLN